MGNSPAAAEALDGIDIEAPLTGTLIVLRNHDVPGVVGRVGTVLGEHGINIANFALGRSSRSQRVPQGQALAVLQVDARTPGSSVSAAVEALRKVEAVVSVRVVELSRPE